MAIKYYLIKTQHNIPLSEKLEEQIKASVLDCEIIEEGFDLDNETIKYLREKGLIQFTPSVISIDTDDDTRLHEIEDHNEVKNFKTETKDKLDKKVK